MNKCIVLTMLVGALSVNFLVNGSCCGSDFGSCSNCVPDGGECYPSCCPSDPTGELCESYVAVTGVPDDGVACDGKVDSLEQGGIDGQDVDGAQEALK